jgi:hypothetical protein
MNTTMVKPVQFLAIALSGPLASLVLVLPSLADGKIALKPKGALRPEAEVGVRIYFELNAHFLDEKGNPINGTALYLRATGSQRIDKFESFKDTKFLGIGPRLEVPYDSEERHGTFSEHTADVKFGVAQDSSVYEWFINPSAKINAFCFPNDQKCAEVTARSDISLFEGKRVIGYNTTGLISKDETMIKPSAAGAKDPVVSLILDGATFFTADIYANSPLGPGLEPTLNADFTFGSLDPEIELTLFYGGSSCVLADCASNASFLSSLETMISTGPGGNWSFDQGMNAFIPNNDISLPDFLLTNSSNPNATATLGIRTQGSDPSVEVPGPLPILGIPALLGFSRKLRNRIEHSKVA